jgi:transposase
MKEYIGVDLGKYKAVVVVVVKKDRHGKITGKVTLAVTQAALESYFSGQDRKSKVVVEATGNWMYLYETIERYTPDIVLAHPLKTRAIAEARIKTDTIDATTLAELLSTNQGQACISEFAFRIQRLFIYTSLIK